jgi:hypothetical protein
MNFADEMRGTWSVSPQNQMKPKKAWTEMTTAELRGATKDLNGSVLDKTRPLNARERASWERAKRGRGRPKAAT